MKRTLLKNALIVNEGQVQPGSLVIEGEKIAEILPDGQQPSTPCHDEIDAHGFYLIPGVIDEHVHFRDPGLTHKADIFTESQAAVAGGVTSIMDMPNTNPLTVTLEALTDKMELLSQKSLANYSCYLGATNKNYTLFNQLDPHTVCGVKLFMGSSTGNMLVDDPTGLLHIFHGTDLLIAAHCESQEIIQANVEKFRKQYNIQPGDSGDIPLKHHPDIRSVEACYKSSKLAVDLAQKSGARLHILHISTAKELELFRNDLPLSQKQITAEACTPHLVFTSDDYETYGTRIKCNPAIKAEYNREAIRQAVNNGLIDTIGTDHAPHLLSEKEGGALKAMSGMPMIQFSLIALLDLTDQGVFTIETLVQKMCHAPADLYQINNRGYLRPGYQADLVLINPNSSFDPTEHILSKCQWTPLKKKNYRWEIDKTFVNGHLVYADRQIDESYRGQALRFR
ncbi:MAG: dihydroorotase [Bacteroides sp.]|nr:dihydroorotase [Bacteroides sp.]